MKDILLITPPFTQLNTPYPATAYLKGFLNTKGVASYQMDLGIEVILELFSKQQLQQIFDTAAQNNTISSTNTQRIYALRQTYLSTIEEVISFLQGKNPTFARLICSPNLFTKSRSIFTNRRFRMGFWNYGHTGQSKTLGYAIP